MKLLPQKQSFGVFCASGLRVYCIVLTVLLVISMSLCQYFMVTVLTQIAPVRIM